LAAVKEHILEIENVNFVFDTEDVKTRVYNHLKRGEHLYELTSSLAFNFEIGGAGVNKASALEFIAQREGIARKEILGFGDSANDIKMIEYAGVGVAMENATPEVRAAADFVTTDCEHSGVAHALEAFGLLGSKE
jgi:Cof subfamily protein (haloacid dehalogenase superfamily)